MPDDILMLAPTSFFSDYGCHVRILEEAAVLRERGHEYRVLTYHRGRESQLQHRSHPRRPVGRRLRDGLLLAQADFRSPSLCRGPSHLPESGGPP